ncbi:MAG: Unknown protein [uncultured Thiotrichaceae bacterium]|uniref:Uncharacterized protein n=1 Tax=uncultured Thiotrichaceae bacterium TaxID=298394 RepID=A0A6S6T095_9GAMM|nr:MAG: Unknown protein [uncultured Thiotrichaceae bacterium]
MKLPIHKLFVAITMSLVVAGCGEEAEVKKEAPVAAENPIQAEEQAVETEAMNEGLYDLKSSINSAIGASIEEDIRDAVENQIEKNNKQ